IVALVEERLHGTIAPLAISLIQMQAQGNPFFTEELVDALVESEQLHEENGIWNLAPALIDRLRSAGSLVRRNGEEVINSAVSLSTVDLGIPSTIQGIILARLDRLPESVKLTVKVASVIGRLFGHDLLSQAHPLQIASRQLQEELDTLLLRDFAKMEAPSPRLTYIFKHNLTQEVVYQTLLTDQRQELHLGVATALEAAQPDRLEDLATHYYNSNLEQEPIRTKALHYLEAAGLRAKRDYANETALSYFERALGLTQQAAWLKAKVEILHILGRRTEEEATLVALKEETSIEPFALALLWAEYYEAVSDYSQTEEKLNEALRLAEIAADAEGVARCRARLGMVAWRQGNYDRAEQIYLNALQGITTEGRFADEEAEIRYGLGLVYRQQGKFEEARAAFDRDLALNQQLNNRQGEARARNALGIIEQTRSNYAEAITHFERALLIRETIGDRAGVGASQVNIAQNLSAIGNYSDAEQMLRSALRIQQALSNGWWQAIIHNELGILHLTTGNLPQAREALEEGLRLSEKVEQQGIRAYLLCNLGQVLRDSGEVQYAEAILQEGLRLAEAQGDTHLSAIYCNDLALVYLRLALYEEAILYAKRSLENFSTLELELSTTNSLAILAASYLALRQPQEALDFAHQAVQILDDCEGIGPDYPQRDYWMCFQVFDTLGEATAARHAFQRSYTLLQQQAARMIDPAIRLSYLQNIPYHKEIMAKAAQLSGAL
ncbi:MAG: tetratricopeptide repeat protein, partial [Caldilineaceae bacterium]|nr:tetratricopeptide repeat protein [Caldilineaceae bacterium]